MQTAQNKGQTINQFLVVTRTIFSHSLFPGLRFSFPVNTMLLPDYMFWKRFLRFFCESI